MRNLFTIIILFAGALSTSAQHEIEFTFANAKNTNDGSDDFYEVDVLISTTGAGIDFKVGSGLLYFNYNTAAFGTNVFANGNLEVTHPTGTYILGETNGFPIYKDFIQNDNTDSRFAFSFQQGVSSGGYAGNNVTGTADELFHLKIKYADVNQSPNFSFEMNPPFDDQFFTACGPTGFGFADCFNFPGSQITNDNFDSSGAALGGLPVEWLFFSAEKNAEIVNLAWATATEINTSHFEIQRSEEGQEWKVLHTLPAAGNTNESQYYTWADTDPMPDQNYYRIRQVDLDDRFDYSTIETVFMESLQQNFSIFPNPTKESFTILFEKETDTVFRLFNSRGDLILQQDLHGQATVIPTQTYPSGIYYASILQQGKPTVLRLTILE